jgi:signal transduction histidine kinase
MKTQQAFAAPQEGDYEYGETRELVRLVNDAAILLREKGESAFSEFRTPGTRWRQEETYIFVLDTDGNMLLHPDPALEGKNKIDLKDVNGKPIIRGLINAATSIPEKHDGWYHYEWPTPEGLLPRWKTSYVRRVEADSGKTYIIGSGMYNDRMERAFVVDMVTSAVREVEKHGKAAFQLFYDPTGPYHVKNAYIFAIDMDGNEFVNPAFPNLEGISQIDMKDSQGKYINREIVAIARSKGSGWLDYLWPKPGESIPTQKSSYVHTADLEGKPIILGCGVYLADAPKVATPTKKMTANELIQLVRDAAALLEQKGEKAFPEFRQRGSRWFHDEIYFYVWSMDGIRAFHAEKPEGEGHDVTGMKDILGKPFGKMFLETAASPAGEGWVHSMWPEPYNIFPTWKSCYVKRVTFPSGKQYLVGSGVYNMQMDKTLIEDVVDRAVALIEERGNEAFPILRDKKGPFVFMDTYVFVQRPDGTELVNPAQPSLEGKNLIDTKDLKGKAFIRDEIDLALQKGSGWMDCYWYKPGENKPALKRTYVRKTQFNGETFIVGSGLYAETDVETTREAKKFAWRSLDQEQLKDNLFRRTISGEKATLAQFSTKTGVFAPRHSHNNEEFFWLLSGGVKIVFDDREVVIEKGEIVMIPPNLPHAVIALEDSEVVDFFAPVREDWLRGEDQYLR